jgi:hypothetical protein
VLRHGIEPFEFGRNSISPVGPDYYTGRYAYHYSWAIDTTGSGAGTRQRPPS